MVFELGYREYLVLVLLVKLGVLCLREQVPDPYGAVLRTAYQKVVVGGYLHRVDQFSVSFR